MSLSAVLISFSRLSQKGRCCSNSAEDGILLSTGVECRHNIPRYGSIVRLNNQRDTLLTNYLFHLINDCFTAAVLR